MNFVRGCFEVFDDYGQKGELIFKAATTCYKSESITQRTPDDFIKMLKKNQHLSMLEFMWIPIRIRYDYIRTTLTEASLDKYIFQTNKFLKVNFIKTTRGAHLRYELVVSGNARAWLEFIQDNKIKKKLHCYKNLCWFLHNLNPFLFDKPVKNYRINSNIIIRLEKKPNKQHNWVAVKFYNVSRGMTHELVRHRMMSFAQASTRYINFKNFNFIFDFSKLDGFDTGNLLFFQKELNQLLAKIKILYSECVEDLKIPKDLMRQILPIGIAGEICVAGRIEDWKHIFKLRGLEAKGVHWEIHDLISEVEEEFKRKKLI
jgi:hypothetical protein